MATDVAGHLTEQNDAIGLTESHCFRRRVRENHRRATLR